MNQTEIADRLNTFLTAEIPGYRSEIPLIEQLDSIQIFSLIPMMESEFGVEIASVEITGEAFQSVASLTRLLAVKLA